MATSADHARLANLLGAVAIGITDATVGDVGTDADLDSTASAALVTMLDLARSSSVQTLSQLIGLTHSGAVRLVNRLAAAGLVARTPGPDARTVTVAPTRRGRRIARQIRDGRYMAIAGVLSGLTEHQCEQLSTACELLIANLTSARLGARTAGKLPPGGALCRMCDPVACGRPEGHCPAALTAAHG